MPSAKDNILISARNGWQSQSGSNPRLRESGVS